MKPACPRPRGAPLGLALALPFFALLLTISLPSPGAAQEAPLRVGVSERAPYAMAGSDGAWQGIAVDLWRMVAEDLSLPYEFTQVERAAALETVGAGNVDVALAVDATPAGSEGLAFLMPMHTATLAVASERTFGLWRVGKSLLGLDLLRVVASLSVLLLVVGGIVWAIERRRNTEQFSQSPVKGLGDGFWWAGVTLTTIGYGDKAPITLLGRAVAMLWMLVGLAVSAALTASVVSAVNLTGDGSLKVPGDLSDRRVAVVEGSSTAAYLGALDIAVTEVADFSGAFAALSEGEVESVAGGAAELAAAMARGDLDLTVSHTTQDPQYVTIALAPDTPAELTRALDRSVLERITGDTWWELVARYTEATQ